jgi:hypothetical protein
MLVSFLRQRQHKQEILQQYDATRAEMQMASAWLVVYNAAVQFVSRLRNVCVIASEVFLSILTILHVLLRHSICLLLRVAFTFALGGLPTISALLALGRRRAAGALLGWWWLASLQVFGRHRCDDWGCSLW